MDKDSVLYLLMDMRVNGVLDRILEKDEEYLKIARKSGEYLERLEAMELPKEARELIDLHSCEQNALGARYGALAYLLGFSDCVELMTNPMHLPGAQKKTDEKPQRKNSPQHRLKCCGLSCCLQIFSYTLPILSSPKILILRI